MTDTVLTYKGRPITDLTKNELVDAMTWAFQEIEYQRERADRLLDAATLAEPEAPINWAAYFVRQAVVQEQELKAALAEPEPKGPTLDEIDDLCAEHSFFYEDREGLECLLLIITDALARWGK